MNHQVQHHIHIQRPGREDGQPVSLKEHGPAQLRLHRQHRGIEALQMAGLQNALPLGSKRKQLIRLGELRGQRLFHQQVESRIQQGRSYRMMMHRGHGHGGCVHLEIGGQQFVDCRENGNRILGRRIGGAGRVRLHGCYQSNAQPCRFQLAIHAEMVASKGAGPGNSNAHDGFAGYCAASFSGPLTAGSGPWPAFSCSGSFPSTAFRQRL